MIWTMRFIHNGMFERYFSFMLVPAEMLADYRAQHLLGVTTTGNTATSPVDIRQPNACPWRKSKYLLENRYGLLDSAPPDHASVHRGGRTPPILLAT